MWFYLQQDGAPPHYHRHVRAYLDDTLPERWIGRRGAIEYPPRSPGRVSSKYALTCGWNSTWTMDRSKRCYWVPTTVSRPNTSRLLPMGSLEGWSLSTEASCAAITLDTLTAAVRSAVRRHRRYLAASGDHSEYIWLSLSLSAQEL
jgi:hypothetical protein